LEQHLDHVLVLVVGDSRQQQQLYPADY
jgi:hypothetical protein